MTTKANSPAFLQDSFLQKELTRLRNTENIYCDIRTKLLAHTTTPATSQDKALQDRVQELLFLEKQYNKVLDTVHSLKGVEQENIELNAKLKLISNRVALHSSTEAAREAQMSLTRLPPTHHELESNNTKLRAELQSYKEKYERTAKELTEVTAQLSANKAKKPLNGFNDVNSALEKEKLKVYELEKEIKRLQKLSKVDNELEMLRNRVTMQTAQLQSLKGAERRCQDLQQEVARLQAIEREVATLKMQADRASHFQRLYDDSAAETDHLLKLKAERHEMLAKMDEIQGDNHQKQLKLVEAQSREAKLVHGNHTNKVFLQILEDKNQRLVDENKEYQAQLRQATAKLEETKVAKSIAEKEQNNMQQKLDSLQDVHLRLTSTTAMLEVLEDEVAALKAENRRLVSEKDSIANANVAREQEMAALKELKAFHFLPKLPAASTTLPAAPLTSR
eukprot:TRINITY_DN115766_c0_g1_i1.p1 TRINITY_DN115766_c0_g1~~TRINITY_DN115766_c0_g1_i1.p1  ORF type:complete len:450 (+),score=70.30 TRINITY_DN115766_c0_g1_i1:81-1430(+)